MSDKKTKMSREVCLELITVILLGVTAILIAWATWIGSLHAGNQTSNFTKSNNLTAEGNSEWNEASQLKMQDFMMFNQINALYIDLAFAESKGDTDEIDKINWKIDELLDLLHEDLVDAIFWAFDESAALGYAVSPFDNEEFENTYFEVAREILNEADELLEIGSEEGSHSDAFGLVTVIYSVVLFMLGIIGTFKKPNYKMAVVIISGVAWLIATIYMATIPMPTDFSLFNFF
ncbi:MAG: hypothetical protein FWD34_08255 [Oscillospiraceae bacterium]|nr:hypothetical protein [Oscillospiraceae bacterium]